MKWPDIFLFCFALGTLWAFASVLLGGLRVGHVHHHGALRLHGHHSHGAWGHMVNPSCIAVFLAWFGGLGYVLSRHSSLHLVSDLLLATVAGIAGALIMARFLAFLQNKERVLNPADYEMTGTLGHVAATIRPSGIGEIVYVRDGARRAVPARSEDGDAIERGTEIIVLRYEKGVAFVRTWDAMTQ